jgi:hypothetical protein
MRKISVALLMGLIALAFIRCGSKKPPKPIPVTDPKYYFVINDDYTWYYVRLGLNCIVTDHMDSVTVLGKNDRYVEGIQHSGWDILTLPAGDTSFAYQVSDTILYLGSLHQTLPPNRILVGPVQAGTSWEDRPPYTNNYSIVGFEDLYSPVAGETYAHCAKVTRTSPGSDRLEYYWWSTEYGKVKEVEYKSTQCQQGMELKYLDKAHIIP